MEYRLPRLMFLLIGIAQVATGQEAESQTSRASIGPDESWGTVTPGTMYVITPSGFKEPPGPGEGAGITVDPFRFEIRGAPGATLTVALVVSDSFSSDDSHGSIPLSNWTYGWFYESDNIPWMEAGPLVGDTVRIVIGGDGVSYLNFGGSTVAVPPTAFIGGYTAQVRATYLVSNGTGRLNDMEDNGMVAIFDTVVYRTLDVVEITDVVETGGRVGGFALYPNYPNPFNPATTIGYSLPSAGRVTLTVFDILGQEVATLVDEVEERGYHKVTFDAGSLPSGVYTYRITAGTHSGVKKMLLLE